MFLLDGMRDVKLIVIFIYQINEASGVDLLYVMWRGVDRSVGRVLSAKACGRR